MNELIYVLIVWIGTANHLPYSVEVIGHFEKPVDCEAALVDWRKLHPNYHHGLCFPVRGMQ